jgi:hypothetical protein
MSVDIADAAPEERLVVDQARYFLVRRDDRLRQILEVGEDGRTLSEAASF